jgi:predicted enzyme related to lactoylglutathione lyase
MGERERYEPGTFCWVDLMTTDSAGAKAFYGELFGWEAEDMPAGESATYTMLRLSGDYVCALYEIGAEGHEQGTPPQWFSYVSVEDADATAGRARELGGEVVAGPLDLGAGRIAVVNDPQGEGCALFERDRRLRKSRSPFAARPAGATEYNRLDRITQRRMAPCRTAPRPA